MKKNFFYALMSAIALTGAIGFTACSSDSDAVVENNPTYDGTSVRTDFAFNITKASQASTRMTAANVQQSSTQVTFRGMEHMFLLSFTGEPTEANKATLSSNANIFVLGQLANSEITDGTNHKKLYSLTFPIGTNNMLFYGAATRNNLENKQIGKVTSTLWPNGTDLTGDAKKTPSEITFSLSPIDDSQNSLGTDDAKIAAYLTTIAKAKYDNGTTDDTTDDITWASCVSRSASNSTFRALADLYSGLTVKSGEARSGSTENVKRMIFDLYKSAYAINYEGNNNAAAVKGVAKAICQAIESTSDGITFVVKNGDTTVDIDANSLVNSNTAESWTSTLTGVDEDFPSNLGLPMGAAQLRFNSSTSTFEFNTDADNSNPGLIVGNDFSVDLSKIDYPAELIYFDNSPIRVSDEYKSAGDFPYTPETWDASDKSTPAEGFDNDWTTNGAVSSTTRAVALQNNVNYGVALLESTVQLASGVTNLTDNKKAILGGTQENQTNINPAKFTVTGILVGGQTVTVNWNMVNASSTFENVIYDSDVAYGIDPNASSNPKSLTTAASNSNYTIVFDNYSSGDQKDVLIALEIKNGDQDFYGKHNLIPAGSTFYLVGKLQLANGVLPTGMSGSWSGSHGDYYRLTNENTKRVFIQDYKTTANISISATSLQNAYSTIPDLVSTETVFGLSVDLKWTPGLTFSVEM